MPNDVQLNGRKVAGVLVEMRAQDKAPHLAVVGIGINVNQCRDDFPAELQDSAISLAMALGRQVDRQNFAVALLRNLDLTYREKFSIAVAEGADVAKIAHTTLPRSTPALELPLLRQPLVINARRNFGRLDLAAPAPEHVCVRNRDIRARGDVDQSPPYARGAVACPCRAPRP